MLEVGRDARARGFRFLRRRDGRPHLGAAVALDAADRPARARGRVRPRGVRQQPRAGAEPVTDPAGGRADVGGYELAYECRGEGEPTVILEAGLGAAGTEEFFGSLDQIAGTTRVCTYDRAGTGVERRPPGRGARDRHADGGGAASVARRPRGAAPRRARGSLVRRHARPSVRGDVSERRGRHGADRCVERTGGARLRASRRRAVDRRHRPDRHPCDGARAARRGRPRGHTSDRGDRGRHRGRVALDGPEAGRARSGSLGRAFVERDPGRRDRLGALRAPGSPGRGARSDPAGGRGARGPDRRSQRATRCSARWSRRAWRRGPSRRSSRGETRATARRWSRRPPSGDARRASSSSRPASP